MSDLTLDDLARILRECAGEDEAAIGGPEFARATFHDLGYDSVAVLEAASRLQREYGVRLTDEEILGLVSPAQLLDLARHKIAAPSGPAPSP